MSSLVNYIKPKLREVSSEAYMRLLTDFHSDILKAVKAIDKIMRRNSWTLNDKERLIQAYLLTEGPNRTIAEAAFDVHMYILERASKLVSRDK